MFLSGPEVLLAGLKRSRLVGRRGANSCEVSRMVGQRARRRKEWQVAKARNTRSLVLKPGHAPSTGAERGWLKGYKEEGEVGPTKKRWQIEPTSINLVFVLDAKLHAIVK